MGVYISGMDMPTGHPLWIAVHADGTVEANEVNPSRPIVWRTLRNAARPVPPHGRLIDADALRQSIKESIDECHKWANEVEGGEMYARVSQALATFVECSLRVKAAPTIIPAEEGDCDND